jgi:DNA adenine methylase
MKTPITYYGGKQKLAETIIRLIPPHKVYVEPFAGGLAVFFAKSKSETEIINDINSEIVNMYEVMKNDFYKLKEKVDATLYSRALLERAGNIYENRDRFDKIDRAWAVWLIVNMSYGGLLSASFIHSSKANRPKKLANKIENFTDHISSRLHNAYIECCEALPLIKKTDAPETFFYIDPPYIGADQGHYKGYSAGDFQRLLDILTGLSGKFILSSYPGDILNKYASKNNWSRISLDKFNSMKNDNGHLLKKTEVLTANYPIEKEGYGILTLFD